MTFEETAEVRTFRRSDAVAAVGVRQSEAPADGGGQANQERGRGRGRAKGQPKGGGKAPWSDRGPGKGGGKGGKAQKGR